MKTSSKITPPKLEHHLLKRCPTKEISFRSIKENEWLVETTTRQQSESLLSMTNIDGVGVEVTKHVNLNSIKGTVILPKYDEDEEEIDKKMLFESLQMRYSNVEDLELYNIPNKKYPDSPLKVAKIKFQGQNLPSKIIVFGQNREIRPYVPSPLQCKNCSKFGHTTKKCFNQSVCAYCSSSDHETKWKCGQARCINCGQNHHSRSKECCFYLYNAELRLLQDRTGMSIKEAKLELQIRGFKDPSKNPLFKTLVQSNTKSDLVKQNQKNTPNRNSKNITSQTENSADKMTIEHPNQYALLSETEMEEESNETQKDNEDSIPNEEDSISNKEDSIPNKEDRKRTLARTPPKSKKQNLQDDDEIMSTIPKIKPEKEITTEIGNKETDTKEQTTQGYDKENLDHSVNPPLSFYEDKTENSNDIVQQKFEAEAHANISSTQTDKDKVEKLNQVDAIPPSPVIGRTGRANNTLTHEISPSPILGKMGKSFSKEKLSSGTQHAHSVACGCNDCFIHEYNKIKHITTQKASNLIDNFVRNKRKNQNIETHKEGCLCVDHLIKKRSSSKFSLESLIEKIQQKESLETTIKTDSSDSKFKSKSNTTKISRNNTLPNDNQQPPPQ